MLWSSSNNSNSTHTSVCACISLCPIGNVLESKCKFSIMWSCVMQRIQFLTENHMMTAQTFAIHTNVNMNAMRVCISVLFYLYMAESSFNSHVLRLCLLYRIASSGFCDIKLYCFGKFKAFVLLNEHLAHYNSL